MAANRYPPASLVVTVSAAVSLSACAGRQYRPAVSRAGVQVITAEQIARSGASTAWDVLKREAPTLTLRDTRGGRPASAGQRGRSSIVLQDAPLVVLDGVRLTASRPSRSSRSRSTPASKAPPTTAPTPAVASS